MALTGLPPDTAVVGSIEIDVTLGPHGQGVSYGLEGLSPEAAIGHLIVVADRLREERRLQWDTCPGCGLPWDEHDEDDEWED